MKKNSLVLSIIFCLLLVSSCTTFPAKSESGLFVNDSPVFSVSYPTNWLEKTPDMPNSTFKAEDPQGVKVFRIFVNPNVPVPTEYSTKIYITELSKAGKDINVLHEKGIKLKDGTAAYEAEIEWIANTGIKVNSFFLTTKKDEGWIVISLTDRKGKINEDFKQIAYSLRIRPGNDKEAKKIQSKDINKVPINPTPSPTTPISTFENGKLYQALGSDNGNLYILSVKGSWREMGRQYGYLFKDLMGEFYQSAFPKLKMSYDKIKSMSEEIYKGRTAYLQEFITAMAETSGFSIEKQKIICFLPTMILLESRAPAACSSMSAWGEYTGGKPLVIGRNWDYINPFPLFKKFVVVVVYNPKGSQNLLADVNYVGTTCFNLTSINNKGIYIDVNAGWFSDPVYIQDSRRTSSFSAMLLDVIFNCSSISEFEERLLSRANLTTIGTIINVADAKECRTYELATNDTKKRTGNGLEVSSNHFISPNWKRLPDVPSGFMGFFSKERLANLQNLAERYKGTIDAIQMMEIFDKSLDDGGPTMDPFTIFQVVTMPLEKVMWVKAPGFSNWNKIDLNLYFRLNY
jgi:hypothetical protein